MSDTPAPLVPADVDLRGYEFMPYYGDRLRESDLNSRATDAEYRAAHNLWWSSWKQVPAASLPDDDVTLCRLADLGRDMKTWNQVKVRALHGFVKCGDGRLYHRVLSPLAIEAWEFRNKQRNRTEAARLARLSQKNNAQLQTVIAQSQKKKSPVTESTGQDRSSKAVGGESTSPTRPDEGQLLLKKINESTPSADIEAEHEKARHALKASGIAPEESRRLLLAKQVR